MIRLYRFAARAVLLVIASLALPGCGMFSQSASTKPAMQPKPGPQTVTDWMKQERLKQ
jgi:hypothetical protein